MMVADLIEGHLRCVQIGDPISEDLSEDEMRAQFALWAIAKSPLFMSADLR